MGQIGFGHGVMWTPEKRNGHPAARKGGAAQRWLAIQAKLPRRVARLPLDVSVLPRAFLVGTAT